MIKFTEIKNRKNNTLRGILNLPNNIENPFIVLNLHGFGGSMSGYKYSHTHLSSLMDLDVLDLIFMVVVKVMENLKK